MKPHSELLGKLHQLSATDRAWIVERLSERERAQLFATLSSPAAAPEIKSTIEHRAESADALKTLSRVEPRLVAAITRTEPAWLNAVIASAQHESWRKAFLDALPTALRADVERSLASQFGAALTESVTRLVLERCRGDVPVESPIERFIERLSSARSKRRMTLHL